MEILRLHPLSQCELAGSEPAFLDRAFEAAFQLGTTARQGSGLADRGAAGLAGIEVKASATVTLKDFRGLRKLKEDAGHRFKAGVVLYDGETCVGFGEGLFAVPFGYLWDPRK